jgi:hypothetical protein
MLLKTTDEGMKGITDSKTSSSLKGFVDREVTEIQGR